MWLWYDWQAAAVADDEGVIHDVAVWDGFFDQRALIERLQCIANGGLTQEAMLLHERFPEAKPTIHGMAKLPMRIGHYHRIVPWKPQIKPQQRWLARELLRLRATQTEDWNIY